MTEITFEPLERSGEGMPFEEVQTSDEWTPIGEFLPTEEMNRFYTNSIEDSNPWYLTDSPFGGKIVNPIVLHLACLIALTKHFPPPGFALHAKQKSEFIKPAIVDRKVKIAGRIADKYIKNNYYIELQARVTDENDDPVLIHSQTRMIPMPKEKK